MSLCSVILCNDFALMAADSRACNKINGEMFASNDNAQKIFKVNDMLIFISGIKQVGSAIIEEFKTNNVQSIEILQEITKKVAKEYISVNNEMDNERKYLCVLGVLEFDKKQNQMCFYTISSLENYKIRKYYACGSSKTVFCGVKEKEAGHLYDIYCKKSTTNVSNMLLNIYNDLSCEQIGGTLSVYTMFNEKEIRKDEYSIKDKRNIRRLTDLVAQQHFQLKGMVIKDNSNNTTFSISSDGHLIINNNGSNGISLDTTNGLVCENSAKTFRTVLNATYGFMMQSGSSGVYTKNVAYLDTNGKLNLDSIVLNGGHLISNVDGTGKIEIGADSSDSNIDNKYSIRFFDNNATMQGRMWYRSDTSAMKILSNNDISLECGEGNTIYLGHYDSANKVGTGAVNMMGSSVTDMNIDSSTAKVDGISLQQWLNNNCVAKFA